MNSINSNFQMESKGLRGRAWDNTNNLLADTAATGEPCGFIG